MSVRRAGRTVEIPTQKLRLAFAYLVVHRHRAVGRAELIDAVWPDELPSAPDAVLSSLLSRLRRLLGADVLVGRSMLRLELGDAAAVDVERPLQELDRARQAWARRDAPGAAGAASRAAALPIAELVAGADVPWVAELRLRLEAVAVDATEVAGRAALAFGPSGAPEAERAARSVIERAPFRESAHLLLMEALVATGNPAEAVLVYDDLRRRLWDDVGLAPMPALRELHRRLVTQAAAPGDSEPLRACREPAPRFQRRLAPRRGCDARAA